MAARGERRLDDRRARANTGRVQAIVSAVDEPQRASLENIWGELRAVFGLRGLSRVLLPHFTYQLAERYDERVEGILSRVAGACPPFDIETHGLGLSRGPRTLLYLHVTRGAALDALHERLWHDATPAATGASTAYAGETWVPHITLTAGELEEQQLPEIAAFLGRHEYRWRMTVTNICLVPDTGSTSVPWRRFELRGRGG